MCAHQNPFFQFAQQRSVYHIFEGQKQSLYIYGLYSNYYYYYFHCRTMWKTQLLI